jgi:hypothetical protein
MRELSNVELKAVSGGLMKAPRPVCRPVKVCEKRECKPRKCEGGSTLSAF